MHQHPIARLRRRFSRIPITTRQAKAASAVVAVVLATLGLSAVSRFFSVTCSPDTPCLTVEALANGAPLPEALRVYDRDGGLIAEVAGPLRRSLRSDQIPDLLADAFVAVEDRRFRSHEGVDLRGVARAVVSNLKEGGISEGASTIPMQLVRTLWAESLTQVGPWRRKVIEARTAPRLVEEMGHERVLTLYLNSIYMGNGIYGVERASRHYFGVGVGQLDIDQMAVLVGMTRSPELFEPRRHPERALGVRNVVLDLLAEADVIGPEEAAEAAALPLRIAPLDSVPSLARSRSHLTAAVTRSLRDVAPELANRPGLILHTTIAPRVQEEAERALEGQLAAIESGRFGRFDDEGASGPLQGAAVALDPASGAVLAWVGGRDFSQSQFDRVAQAKRQVGSLVKPFLVALALEQGHGVIDMVSADTVPIPTDQGSWLPADHVAETSMPLREALVRSSNRAAAHLGMALGLGNVSDVGARVGLTTPIPSLPATSIGAFDASLLEMTGAYAAFGNGGISVQPHLLTRIDTSDGTVLWTRSDSLVADRILDETTAYVVLDAMRAVVDRGTGTAVRGYGYRGPAAGKTGTTNDGRDAWFVGLTPDVVAGVWIGFDTPRPVVKNRGGGELAAPAWATWMRGLGDIPQQGAWIPPRSVERVRYDPSSGEVVGPHCGTDSDVAYREAWVGSGMYDRSCPRGGIRRWLDGVWRALVPGTDVPARPDPIGSGPLGWDPGR